MAGAVTTVNCCPTDGLRDQRGITAALRTFTVARGFFVGVVLDALHQLKLNFTQKRSSITLMNENVLSFLSLLMRNRDPATSGVNGDR